MPINFRERYTKEHTTVMCSPVSIQISQLVCLIKVLHCLGLVRQPLESCPGRFFSSFVFVSAFSSVRGRDGPGSW